MTVPGVRCDSIYLLGVRLWSVSTVRQDGSWASSEAIRKTMVGCRSRDTRPEKALRSAVHRLGLRFRVCMRPIKEIRRTADIVFTRTKVAVFLDGCFWHGCAEHFVSPKTNTPYWMEKISGNQRRDQDTDARLKAQGWTVVRVWEHEDSKEAALRVQQIVQQVRQKS